MSHTEQPARSGPRPGLPTTEQVLALPLGARITAPPEWEDFNGHVNVAAYYSFHMRAISDGLGQVGWDESYVARTGRSFFSVEQHLRFYDEVLVGHDLNAHFRLLGRNDRFLHGVSILVDLANDRVANTVQFLEAHVDLSTRRTVPLSGEFAEQVDRLMDQHRQLPWSVPLNQDMGLG